MFNVDMKKNGGWLLQLLDNKTKYEAVPGKRRDLPRGGGKRDVDSFDSHKLTSSLTSRHLSQRDQCLNNGEQLK